MLGVGVRWDGVRLWVVLGWVVVGVGVSVGYPGACARDGAWVGQGGGASDQSWGLSITLKPFEQGGSPPPPPPPRHVWTKGLIHTVSVRIRQRPRGKQDLSDILYQLDRSIKDFLVAYGFMSVLWLLGVQVNGTERGERCTRETDREKERDTEKERQREGQCPPSKAAFCPNYLSWERDRERGRVRERETERDRDRQRQRDRDRERDREAETERGRQTETDRQREAGNAHWAKQRSVPTIWAHIWGQSLQFISVSGVGLVQLSRDQRLCEAALVNESICCAWVKPKKSARILIVLISLALEDGLPGCTSHHWCNLYGGPGAVRITTAPNMGNMLNTRGPSFNWFPKVGT